MLHFATTRLVLKLLTVFAILLTLITLAGNERHAVDAAPLVSDLRISQVYGGGGNSGATYTHDFIELFNAGTTSISLTGYSVQYASSSGTSWSATVLSGSIGPGQYFLIQEAAGSGGTTALPTPDVIGTIAMSGASGKVALVSSTTALSGSCPSGGALVDFVGYGSANCYEGSGATPTLTNTTAALRADDGCTDTDDNANDFATGAPNPRNTSSPTHACGMADVPPTVASTSPDNGATDVAISADIEITFSEDVTVTGSWYDISCSASGTHTAAQSGGPQTYTLDPDTDFVFSETCTVTIYAANVVDQDGSADNMVTDYIWSFTTESAPISSPMIINEVDADTPGTDAAEFVELYDGGAGNTALDGLVIVFFNGSGDTSYAAFDLDGYATNGSGYFLLGNAGVSPTPDITFAGNLLQNGADAVALYQADAADFPNGTAVTTSDLIDALVYDTDDGDDTGLLVLLNAGQPQINEDANNNSDTESNGRCPNGSGGARNTIAYTQSTPTPGADNDCGSAVSCTTIPEIQGTTDVSPCENQTTPPVPGCIIGIAANGFYFQDVAGDGNTATSDGLFVYRGGSWTNSEGLETGNLVTVSGQIIEFFNITEYQFPNTVIVTNAATDCGGAGLPSPVTIAPVTDPNADPISQYEQYESMRAAMSFDGWVVGPTRQFVSRFAPGDPEIAFVDFGSTIPDYSRVMESDYPGYQGISYLSGGLNVDLPDLDFGDEIAGTDIIGVFAYNFDKYTLLPETTPVLTTVDNPDVVSNTPALNAAAQEFDVCSFNVENLFDHLDDGQGDWGDWAPGWPTPGTAAGLAAYTAKLDGLADVIVNDMQSCMVIGLQEVEGKQAVYDALAAAATAAAAGHSWTAIYVESGDSRDISQGFLYRDDVTLLSGPTAVAGAPYTTWVLDGMLDFVRVPASADFRFHAATAFETDLTIYALHMKSKRSSASCSLPDCTDVREKEAADLRDILAHHQTNGEFAAGIGDFNDVLGSSPITILDNSPDSANLYDDLSADARYSYIFGGQSETLDYIYLTTDLATPAPTGDNLWEHAFGVVHVHADFPASERQSDHDPVRVRFAAPDQSALPASFGTAWHYGGGALRLGTEWNADADTSDIMSSDGVTFNGIWQTGQTITVSAEASADGWLACWFDWDMSQAFESSNSDGVDERSIDQAVAAGLNTIPVVVPASPVGGGSNTTLGVRCRLYEVQPARFSEAQPVDGANAGEVEDYSLGISPTAVKWRHSESTQATAMWQPILLLLLALTAGSVWFRRRLQ
ncbi:MAG: lamin tail domain-containing protein [Anaerolineae bacterium]|nr:lamin tail domain-containing protein [Anaerolineae bacterium]